MENSDRQARDKTRRSLLAGGAAAIAGVAGWRWIASRGGDLSWPLRRTLEFNRNVAQSYFSPARLSREYPMDRAGEPKPNGDIGLEDEFDPSDWKLALSGFTKAQSLTLADVQRLPRVEVTTELRCIEGWSQIVHWAGARLSDFAANYGAQPSQYVSLETPDAKYYVGLDRAGALHPQTLLCYEMNGATLSDEHGAPLRLVIPVKYGIKNLKRIGKITFTDTRPKDYWAEQGYDWYAGL
jgi:DMSO/TMAO reductase YedYZ molybdopterin-dependent catalytic subunit